jgi:hypothetical protein
MFILRLKDIDYYPETEWTIGDVMAKRRVLMCEEPIISRKITRLDLWLSDRPEVTLEEIDQIWIRMLLVSSIQYELEQDPEQRGTILLAVREHFEEFRRLPEKWQARMRPGWLPWFEVLNREEREWEELAMEECSGRA